MNKENHNKERTDFFHQKELAFVGIYMSRVCEEEKLIMRNDN